MKEIRLVVLSGPSGSGKSTAIKALEDLGYYCVDNMPVALLPRFMELLARSGEILRVAAVIDVREREFLKDVPPIFAELKAAVFARGHLSRGLGRVAGTEVQRDEEAAPARGRREPA